MELADRTLEHLLARGSFEAAAALAPRLLRDDEGGWEKWVQTFTKLRHLKVKELIFPPPLCYFLSQFNTDLFFE
jgi:hypothetical protein